MASTEKARTVEANPYVGPRPFERGERLWGRDDEIASLYFLLSAARIVLLHSPSGAGKSSLVQAGLIPRLRERFAVWRPTRLNQEPDEAAANKRPVNRYARSAILGFEEGIPQELRRPPEALAGLRLAEYAAGRPKRPGAPPSTVVIFDQFEEVLTVDPLAVAAKRDFFDQLGELLRDPQVWALFVLREDYLAPLDLYADQVPTHLKNRFRIDLLGLAAAREAIIHPAREAGREFPAADQLVHDLATMKVQRLDGSFVEETGQHVEPVQLQVVCRRLWDTGDLSIDATGSVTEALAAYYASSVSRIAGGDLRERVIRDWCGERLITPAGLRGQVLKGARESEGLANDLIEQLRATHLIRAENRAGVTWYELAHDRLIEPVRSDNAAWRKQHLADVQQRAELWEEQGRPAGLLLAGSELKEGERWAAENETRITGLERRFLADSRQAQEAAERERRQTRWIRRLAVGATVVSCLALAALVLAVWQWREATEQKRVAERQTRNAKEQTEIAEEQSRLAEEKRAEAELAKFDAENQRKTAQQERDKTQQSLMRTDIEQAENLISAGRRREALAYLARAVRFDPENSATRGRIFSLLVNVGYPIPNSELLHGGYYSASFSPDGQRVVTNPPFVDGPARLWDAATGEELFKLSHRTDSGILAASFSPNGQRVVTTATDETVRLWNAATGEKLLNLSNGGWRPPLFSPDGGRVMLVSHKASVVWDVVTGKQLHEVPVDGDHRAASFGPAGPRVVTISEQGVRVWNVATGEFKNFPVKDFVYDYSQLQAARYQVEFDLEGRRVVTMLGGPAYVWDAATGRQLYELGVDVSSARFSPDGRQVITASRESEESEVEVHLWDAATGKPERLQPPPTLRSSNFEFSPDGQVIATWDRDAAHLWDVATWKPLGEFRGRRSSMPVMASTSDSVEFSSDGGRLLLTVGADTRIRDALISQPLSEPLHHKEFAWSEPLHNESAGVGIYFSYDVALSPDGQRVVANAFQERTAQVWDVTTGKWLAKLPSYDTASFSSDGRMLVTTKLHFDLRPRDRRGAQLWDAATGALLGELWLGDASPISAFFARNDKAVVTISSDGVVQLWDVATRKPLGAPLLDGDNISSSAALSPDGRRLVTTCHDGASISSPCPAGAAQFWDVATGKPFGDPMRQGEGAVKSVSLSPDGQRLVTTAEKDNTVQLWDAATGRPLGEPLRDQSGAYIQAASFSRDGQRVFTLSDNGMVRVWDVLTASSAEAEALAEMAEVVGGFSLKSGVLEQIPLKERSQRMAAPRRSGELARDHEPTVASFARWYFTPRLERSISLLSRMTVEKYIQTLLDIGTEAARQEAWRAFPRHPLLVKDLSENRP